jgi:hypothetical protein
MKQVPYKYDWVSGHRGRWLSWQKPRYNKKGILTGINSSGFHLEVLRCAAFYEQTPEEYLAQLYDEGWLTGQAEEDIVWIVTTNQKYRRLLETETKNKEKMED